MPTIPACSWRSSGSTTRSTASMSPLRDGLHRGRLIQSRGKTEGAVLMTVRPIVALGNPVLRRKARKVSHFDDAIRTLAQDMIKTMRDAPGVRLAAPQFGVPLQVAVVEAEERQVHVLVNPEIVRAEGEHILDEGCLSVPGYWGRVTRAEKVTVKAKDAHGKEIRISA